MGSRSRFFGIRGGKKSRSSRRGEQRQRIGACQLGIERLEDRRVLDAVTVTNDTDEINDVVTNIAALKVSAALPGHDGISLREAILAANATTALDTITFDPTLLAGETIQLTNGELEVTEDLTINGLQLNGLPNVTIIPEAGFRAFHLTSGELELNYLQVTGAIGGVSVIESTWDNQNPPDELFITVSHCLIDNNSGTGVQSARGARIEYSTISNNDGGGLVLGDGSQVFDCRIEDNEDIGILANGSITIEESTIQRTTAFSNGTYSGKGIVANSGINIAKSLILDNGHDGLNARPDSSATGFSISESMFARNGNNGIHIETQPRVGSFVATIEKTTVEDNQLHGLKFYGFSGNEPDELYVKDSTIAINRDSGVLLQSGAFASAYAYFENCTISGNKTDDLGGGIRVITNGETFLKLTNTTITENVARDLSGKSELNGGGIWIDDYDEYQVGQPKILETTTETVVVNSIISGNKDGDGIDAMPDNIAAPIVNEHPQHGVPPLLYEDGFVVFHDPPSPPITVTDDFESRFNFIGTGVPDPERLGITNGAPGNKIGFNNTQLTPLGNYGGPTETHVPLVGSPVIDMGDPSTPVAGRYDQRGNPFQRGVGVGARIDIGAVEWQPNADFNHDGYVDGSDFLIWQVGFGTGPGATHAQGDANFDGDVDSDDLDIWKAQFGFGMAAIPTADIDSSGTVDGDDFVIWAANFGMSSGATLAAGDADSDGDVDKFDFLAWQIGFSNEIGGWYLNGSNSEFADLTSGTILVSTLEDEDDGDYRLGRLSLREALDIAAQASGVTEIIFANGLAGTIELVLGALAIDSDIVITGPGADKLAVDAGGLSRVFTVSTGVDAAISGMTITGGSVTGGYLTGYGGGIFTDGDLTLTDVDLIGNHASHYGGAVFVHSSGTLTVVNSTFDDNDAGAGGGALSGHFKAGLALSIEGSTFSRNTAITSAAGGGAILHYSNIAGATTFAISNTTFSENSAYNGGAIQFQNPVGTTVSGSIVNSTVAYNTATSDVAGGLFNYNGATITLHNTIVAKNTAVNATYQDAWGSFTGGGASSYNLIGQVGSSGLTNGSNGNKVGTASVFIDPLLAPLGNYGGRTKTHALKNSSPALEAGKNSLTDPYDQRGYQREYGSRDIGAYEAGLGTTLVVRSDGDRNDSISSAATVASLRLREALALSAALAGTETITFDQTGWADAEIDLTLGQLSITQYVIIDGPGADKLAVDAQSGSRVFNVSTNGVQFRGLTIKGGSTTGSGGGIYSNGNSLTIDACEFDSNYAANGGGLYFRDGELALSNSTFYDNHASSNGAGIYLREADKADITNTTISGNVAVGSGGGIYNTDSSSPKIINATIAYNQAATGGGIYNATAGILLSNSIVAQNTATTSRDIHGTFSGSSKNNFIGFDSVTGNGIDDADSDQNQVGGEGVTPTERSARLAPLGYYGGPTKTHALYFDSLAIDNGNDGVAASWSDFDQRGSDREVDGGMGGGVDIGAFEVALGEMFSD